jgi:uncharacterized protein
MNRIRFLLLVCFCFLSFASHAQLCWKVSGNGLEKSSYLFGTLHVIEYSSIPHFNDILDLCAKSEAVVGELVMDATLNESILKGVSMSDKSLSTLLTPDEYRLVDTEIQHVLGASLELLDRMKPLYVGSIYTVMSYISSLGLSEQPTSIDEIFQQKGKDKGLTLIGLETPDEQVNLLYNTIPVERQAQMLVETVRQKDEAALQAEELNKAYLSGNLVEIEKIGKGDQWSVEETTLFVDERNLRWMYELPSLFNAQSCFVAVGCLHLVGETGLINQLRHAGYSVEPMQFN